MRTTQKQRKKQLSDKALGIKNIRQFDSIWKQVYLEDKKNPQPISFYDELGNEVLVIADDEPIKSIIIVKTKKNSQGIKEQESELKIRLNSNKLRFDVTISKINSPKGKRQEHFDRMIFIEFNDIAPYLKMVTDRIQRIKESSVKQAQKYSLNDRTESMLFDDLLNEKIT